ncbi:MAG TPA: RNA polymerase sigma factor [Candidatus Brachybacterium merdigallinarum]|nr:RNA polymerase sigma factor [Candidatus Brachybacterium merdigallinarum]
MGPEAAPERPAADDVLARVHREEHSRLLATLVRRFGDLDLAEEAAQEAMERALTTWPEQGVPEKPLAWLITVARRVALDRVRRDTTLARRVAEMHLQERDRAAPGADEQALASGDLPDDRLAMLMGCCHPAIAPADRIALMLRFVGLLSTAETAAALLVPTATLAARITRAKKRIVANRIPLTVPEDPAERARRLPLVLTAISLVFTEGYAATSGEAPIRQELTGEAIRLARITHRLLPGAAEPQGLLALLLLNDARSRARVDADGTPVALQDQDRSCWDAEKIEEGLALVEEAAGREDAGRFTIQAAIAAVHAEAPAFESTDWAQIVSLYSLLLMQGEDPVVRMNRAIAIGRRDGPEAGLALLEELEGEPGLAGHHPYHVALALFRTELGRDPDSAWAQALALAGNAAERRFIARRRHG